MALGDFDNDGAVDVLAAVNNDAPVLLRNHAGKQNHWLGVRLVGRKANPDAVERFTDLPIDRYITIVEGQGISK